MVLLKPISYSKSRASFPAKRIGVSSDNYMHLKILLVIFPAKRMYVHYDHCMRLAAVRKFGRSPAAPLNHMRNMGGRRAHQVRQRSRALDLTLEESTAIGPSRVLRISRSILVSICSF